MRAVWQNMACEPAAADDKGNGLPKAASSLLVQPRVEGGKTPPSK